MLEADPQLNALRSALECACRCTHVGKIINGRKAVLSLPREWVLSQIEHVACESLDLTDEWDYRRLLELFALLDQQLVDRLVAIGMNSTNEDIREAAEDFRTQ